MDNLLLVLQREVVDTLEHLHQLRQLLGGVFLPALFHRLFVIRRGSLEEERAQGPQLMDKRHTILHHRCHLQDALRGLLRTVFLDNRLEEGCNLLIRLHQDILMVKPDGFLIGELRTSLRAL